MAKAIQVLNETHWHELRAQNVGASEIASLFGASPYSTKFTLWHEKSGKIARPEFDSERMEWGNLLEPVIAQGIAKRQDWTIRKVRRYLIHKAIKGMGASLDYEVVNHPDGVGALEIKNVSIESWKRGWIKNEDGTIEAPLHIELQLQHQMAVTGHKWGAIGFLIGGNEAHVVIRQRHEPTIQRIESAVIAFWESIEKNEAPAVEDAGDLAAVIQLFEGGNTVENETETFRKVVETFRSAQEARKLAAAIEEESKGNLIHLLSLHEAEVMIGNGFKVTYKEQSRKETITQASTFRVLRVSEIKKGKES